MIRLLLDQGLPVSLARLLRDAHFDAVHVSHLGMAAATDEAIIGYARTNGYIFITLNADFHSLLALSGDSVPSVLTLSLKRMKADELAKGDPGSVGTTGASTVESGFLATVTRSLVRVLQLPIKRR